MDQTYEELGRSVLSESTSDSGWMRHVQGHVSDIIITVAGDGRITTLNPAFKVITGWNIEEWLGKEFANLIHPSDRTCAANSLRCAYGGESPGAHRIRLRSKAGSFRPAVLTIAPRIENPTSDYILCVIGDGAAEQKATDELREKEERFRALLESTNAVPFESDLYGTHFTYVGPQIVRLLGYPVDEWYTENFWIKHLHPDDRRWVSTYCAKAAKRSADCEFEYRMIASDGRVVWIRDLVHTVTGGDARDVCRGFMIDVTARKEAREQLEQSQHQLRALAARGQAAREDERIRIAREIHDELGQTMTALKMGLSCLRSKLSAIEAQYVVHPLANQINLLEDLAQQTIQSVRQIATQLRPPILDKLGLAAAIEWQARQFKEQSGLLCDLSIRCTDDELDGNYATAAFRIFQEILTNIGRHSQANKVHVRFWKGRRSIVLRVLDNGRGITAEEAAGMNSLGLLGMRERALFLGGTIKITGRPGRGTCVKLKIPLADKSRCQNADC